MCLLMQNIRLALVFRAVVALAVLLTAPEMASAPALAETESGTPTPGPTLDERAASGDVTAIAEIGDRYRTGDGVPVDLNRALEWYARAAEMGDINSTYFMGLIYQSRPSDADQIQARSALRRAVDLCEEEVNRPTCNPLYIYRALGLVQKEQALYSDAIVSARNALAIAENPQTLDETAAAYLYEDLGVIYDVLRLGAEALDAYEKAEALHRKIGTTDPQTLGNLLLNKANSLDALNRHEESIRVSEQALGLIVPALGEDNLLVGYLRNNIGWSLMGLQRYEDAYAEYEKALPIISKAQGAGADKVGYVLNNMGIIRERQGRHEEAIRLNIRALAVYSHFEASTLAPKRWALQSLAHSYRALSRPDTAILFAKMAVNTQQKIRAQNTGLEEAQATALREEWRGIYQDLADMLIEKGRIAEAQHVLYLLKQQELIEFVRRDADGAGVQDAAALTKREVETSGAIDKAMSGPLALAAELDALTAREADGSITAAERQRLEQVSAELDKSYEAFVSDVESLLSATQAESVTVQDEVTALNLDYAADRQEMLREMPRPTVLLQAVSLGGALHLFLTTKDISIHREVKITRADLAQKVFDTLTAIEERSPGADDRLSELYTLLIKPVEADLNQSGAEVIMLNLGGFLRYLPFAALKSERGYLIEDYALAVDTPAAQTKFASVDRRNAVAAGFGVTAQHQGFSPLPGVAKELEAIFEGQDSKGELPGQPMLDTAFTQDSFKDALKKRPQLLHVASHFKFVPGNETDSFLLLGNGDALSLAALRKTRGYRFGGVDLLTLSACETAKGGDAEGDEVESFGAIAQMNGASAVMATLWPIADEPSGRLMADFYAGLVEEGLDKASALRRAQIAMLRGVPVKEVSLTRRGASDAGDGEESAAGVREHEGGPQAEVTTQHPYYWSPYILMGNWL